MVRKRQNGGIIGVENVPGEAPPFSAEYLVVAGGGGGRNYGGGGGGEVLYFNAQSLYSSLPYTITVGFGGAASTDGDNSVFSTNIANGGKGTGGSGFSPGGASGSGNLGGAGGNLSNPYLGGGGGGDSAAGGDYSGNNSGNGGAGTANNITGTNIARGGGGGGGGEGIGGPGIGVDGGGDGAARGASGTGTNGSATTGGGGGGDNGQQSPRYAGGSGVVVLKIPDTKTATFSAGVTSSLNTTGGYNIYTVTAAGTSDTVTFS